MIILSETIKRIRKEACIEFTEKRSDFIAFATVVTSEAEALRIIKKKKKEYYDAKHNVYAYVIGKDIARYSDDKEPQGTAGMPVLNAIKMAGITDVLVVVTRYFGGILLGAGGLVRAYSTAASLALNAAGEKILEPYKSYITKVFYNDYGLMLQELASVNAIVDDTIFSDEINIRYSVREEIADDFEKRVSDVFAGRMKPKFLGTRIDGK